MTFSSRFRANKFYVPVQFGPRGTLRHVTLALKRNFPKKKPFLSTSPHLVNRQAEREPCHCLTESDLSLTLSTERYHRGHEDQSELSPRGVLEHNAAHDERCAFGNERCANSGQPGTAAVGNGWCKRRK